MRVMLQCNTLMYKLSSVDNNHCKQGDACSYNKPHACVLAVWRRFNKISIFAKTVVVRGDSGEKEREENEHNAATCARG